MIAEIDMSCDEYLIYLRGVYAQKEKARMQRATREARKAAMPETAACPVCGIEFRPKLGQKYCSKSCSNSAHSLARREGRQ